MNELFIPTEIAKLTEASQALSEEDSMFKSLLLSVSKEPLIQDDMRKVQGYLRKTKDEHMYFYNETERGVDNRNLVFIPPCAVEPACLVAGDYLEGEAKFVENNACGMIEKLQLVNDKPFKKEYKARINIDYTLPRQEAIYFGEKIWQGTRTLARFSDRYSCLFKMLEELEKKSSDEQVVFIGTEIPPEFYAMRATRPHVKCFYTNFGDGLEKSYLTIINAINHVNALASIGENVFVCVYDIVGILNTLKLYFNISQTADTIQNAEQLTKTLFGLGRCQKECSISLIASVLASEISHPFVASEIQKAVSCIIDI